MYLSIDDDLGTTKYMATGLYCMARYTVGAINLVFVIIFPHFRLFHFWNAVVCIFPTFFWIGALWMPFPVNLVVQWISFLWGIFVFVAVLIRQIGFRIISSSFP
jgi:hypothetical protein